MKKPKNFKWIVEFTVDELWVADGFELTKAVAEDMLLETLGYAFESEVKVRIVKAPRKKLIKEAQGWKPEL